MYVICDCLNSFSSLILYVLKCAHYGEKTYDDKDDDDNNYEILISPKDTFSRDAENTDSTNRFAGAAKSGSSSRGSRSGGEGVTVAFFGRLGVEKSIGNT